MTLNEDMGAYPEAGYCLVRNRSDAATLDRLQAEVQRIIDANKAGPGYAELKGAPYRDFAVALHLKSEPVVDYLRGQPFMDLTLRLIGQDADLRFTSTITKTAERGHGVDWHQDHAYNKEPDPPFFSCWIAVTPTDRENGCLRVVPGSHAHGLIPHIPSRSHPTDKEIPDVDESRAVDLPMERGDILVLDPWVVHGSDHNLSGKLRMSLIVGFQAPKTKYMDWELKVARAYLRGGEPRWEAVSDVSETGSSA